MILEILLVLIGLYSAFISYLLMLALRRITVFEEYILKFQQIVEAAAERIKAVDLSGHYESDDETGFFFDQLKELQEILNTLFEPENKKEENA